MLLGLALVAAAAAAEGSPAIPETDRIRLAEGFRLARDIGDRFWPGWSEAPFAVLLVTPEHEFLMRHPYPTGDFTPAGEDERLGGRVWVRPRRFPTEFLATFPAVAGVPTVVIGQAQNTAAATSTRWVITLLHEHFHQLQDSHPGHYEAVAALDLARGDTTGMWMLDFPFPYDRPEVVAGFSALARGLGAALSASEGADLERTFASYLDARVRFRALLDPAEARYFDFQLWKEGISRYTEARLAELAATQYQPSPAFSALDDFRPFAEVAAAIRDGIDRELSSVDLAAARRTVVYNFGAAEGLLLDRVRPGWRERYFGGGLTLERHFAGIGAAPAAAMRRDRSAPSDPPGGVK